MITDHYILKSIQSIDHILEATFEQVVLPQPSENQDQQDLQILQEQLWQVKKTVDSLATSIRQNSGTVKIDYDKILNVLQKLDTSRLEGISVSQLELSQSIKDCICNYVSICCYYTLVHDSINFIPSMYDSEKFYHDICESNKWSALYFLQTLPQRLAHTLFNTSDEFIESLKRNAHFQGFMRSLTLTSNQFLQSSLPQLNKILMVRNYQLVGLPRDTLKLTGNVTALLKIPLAVISQEVHIRKEAMEHQSKRYTAKLGQLISEYPLTNNTNDVLHRRVNSIAQYFDASKKDTGSVNLLHTLVELIPKVRDLTTTTLVTEYKKPGVLTRYWPTILLALAYGPSTIALAWSSRYKILEFFKRNIVDFTMGLLYNWVWTPLKQVWSTVRHDEDSSIAMMSQGTLDSEVGSLTRMIVQFVVENSSADGLIPDSSVDMDINSLTDQISHGDLTQFMQIYESQLHHPVKNILSGKLIRSLLIQLQKTKVDGSLALHGIDKMLQSQQLVFGVVAMSPALLILYCSAISGYRLVKLGNIWSNISEIKSKISSSLNNVERLLNYENTEHQKLNYLNQGLLTLEIVTLRSSGGRLVPKARKGEWLRDVDELVNSKLSNAAKLNVVNRIYHVYSKYF